MKRIFSVLFTISLLFGISAMAMAQTRTPVINARERNQQRRINQGVKSGELTRGERGTWKPKKAESRPTKRSIRPTAK